MVEIYRYGTWLAILKARKMLQPANNEQGMTMNTLPHNQTKRLENDGGRSLGTWVRSHLAQIVESFWFCLTFLLFLLLGPFSAVVVLIGLGSLASEENRAKMTEPARL